MAQTADFALGPLSVRPSVCQVICDGRPIHLQPRVMQVLAALARAHGRPVSRDALLASCWDGLVVGDDSIHRCIASLRRLSEQEAPGAFRIVTQARVGYRLVTAEADEAPVVEPAPENIPEAPRRNPSRGVALRAAVAVIALLAAGALAYRVLVNRPAPSAYRIAVRDFTVEGPDAGVGRALADRVTAAVADRQLPVVTRDRSGRGDLDGAHYVVGGAVRQTGPSTRVDIELDDVQSGLTLWSDSIARSTADADALNDQVAGKVADLMDLTRRWLGKDGDKASPDAVAALFKAADVMRGGQRTILQTREAFRRFRDLDPTSSKGHSAFAMATALGLRRQPPNVAAQWAVEARAEAERAIALDPHNGEGYMALGVVTPSTDLAGRERWYLKGLSVAPNDASLCNFLGNVLLDAGRTAEALVWIDRSQALDPLSGPKTDALIFGLIVNGRFADAAALFPRAERLWPEDQSMRRLILTSSLIYAAPNEAVGALEAYQAGSHPLPAKEADVWNLYERARGGGASSQAARKALAGLAATAPVAGIDTVVEALATLGDVDGAFQVIAAGRDRGQEPQSSILYEPATRSLRRDPRFMAIAERLGAADYWAKTGRKPDFCATEGPLPACRHG